MRTALRLCVLALPLLGCANEMNDNDDATPVAADPRSQLEAFPGQTGPTQLRRVHTPSGDVDVTVANIDGYAIAEGDIIVGDSVPDGARSNIETSLGKRWPGGVVPYAVDPALPDQWRVGYGIAAWERTTQLHFVPRTTQSDYVYIQPGAGCSSAVGMQGGRQVVTLGGGCQHRAAIHELGHAIGLWHEQSRSDRDTYVNINWGNIQGGQAHNFNLNGAADGYFDWDSIMLYGSSAFSIDTANGDLTTVYPTLVRKDGTRYDAQGLTLSSGDVAAVRFMYRNGRDDLNGDRNADLIWRSTSGDTDIDFLNGLNLRYTQPFGTVPTQWKLVGSGDFDADDEPDLLWRNTASGEVGAWMMRVEGGVRQYVAFPTIGDQTWQIARVYDVDSDGDADIIWRNTATGLVSIWRMENAAFAGYREYPASLDWTMAGVGDFDNDGKVDIVWRHTGWNGGGGTGDVAMWQFDTAGNLINGNVFWSRVPLEWRIDGIGDTNRDSYSDIVWRNTRTGDVAIWNMVGRVPAAMLTISSGVGLDWQIRQIADIDGDGDGDIVWRNIYSGGISLWQIENSAFVTYGEPIHRGTNWDLVVGH